VAAGYMRW